MSKPRGRSVPASAPANDQGQTIRLSNGITLRLESGWLTPEVAGIVGSRTTDRIGEQRTWRSACGLLVLESMDETPRWGPMKHVSLSRARKHPTWSEILAVREAFFDPETQDAMMILPRQGDYVDVQAHTFHLWETPESWGMR